MWPFRAAPTLQPETRGKEDFPSRVFSQPRHNRNSPRRSKARAGAPPPRLPGEGGEQPHVSGSPTEEWSGAGAGRRRARRRPGSARPALPSLRGPPARAAVTRLPRGPLAGMTAADEPHPGSSSSRPQGSGSEK